MHLPSHCLRQAARRSIPRPFFPTPAHLRSFTTTPINLARRKQTAGERRDEDDGVKALTGNLAVDGVHRYELDFLETAEWVKELLVKMRDDQGMLKDLSRPFTPPTPHHTLIVETRDRFTYDFTQPAPVDTDVKLHVPVAGLNLDAQQRHKLLLLAGQNYDPYIDVITLKKETPVEGVKDALSDRDQNRVELARAVRRMVEDAKDTTDSFTDIPLDMRHLKPRNVGLEFPQEWLKPRQKRRAATATTN
ncbi:mitochondrial ribosomal subunit protein-domain-containing protein [Fimicolochytrium jonesii]|uniref:mitochondrial ribosomal subunit protein-domain-containing protein n=1 Tax=Fimicolochytrium jonesii TaxID=1396493 RepID=UPI0022FED85A|nr:mitochondrial ribosomal subunit protein-domain-containing protein [Fimicolochytrium jonesii]KAI8820854.1 mitochondrial ribosomal subunit protein-domain-containing protein [Fimicolochytrium jonesii]